MDQFAAAPLTAPNIDAGPYRLREFSLADAPLISRAGADPLIPLITTVPVDGTAEDHAAFILRQQQRLRDGTGYSLAIADAATNHAVGQIGLWLQNQDNGIASIGYWVDPEQRRRGIAAHALVALSTWGLSLPQIHRLELYVEPWNEGSWRTAEACGFQREGLLRSFRTIGGQRRDLYMYSLLPSGLPLVSAV
ncbi:N-acetyltransferase [Glutamicibacter uratoxydans]|uniref:N-acetyltransferase n=1 Tax=Glutamicibacter uratoxydans TaxID=43667 RepID=A0A4Y4DN38_GLUUR|nr:GNAT family protein [Glutamicibacter uratoxydans]GED04758.1 N-acetyltransferase [Glutamicibacter uratoxydans]